MPPINLNQIRTGSNSVDRLVSAAGAIAANPQAGLSIAKNLINSGVLGGSGPSDPSVGGLRGSSSGTRRGKISGLNDIMYPADLDDQHYMTFRVVESKREKLVNTTKTMKVRSFILPVPGNLVAKYAADYENSEMGVLGALAAGDMSMTDVKKAGASAKGAIESIGSQIAGSIKAGKATEGQKGVGTAAAIVGRGSLAAGLGFGGLIGGGSAAIGAAKITSGLGKRAGLAINPHMAVLFKGIGFKEHTFSFKFIPRDQDESDDIQELCREFRYHMLPTLEAGSLAFGYPDEFQITFSKHLAPYLFTIGNCVLKSFDVTYNGGGVPSFSKGGAPMEIDISMSFQEVNIETRNKSQKETQTMKMASGFGPGKRRLPPDHWDEVF
jgi:hypothetical protein